MMTPDLRSVASVEYSSTSNPCQRNLDAVRITTEHGKMQAVIVDFGFTVDPVALHCRP